MTPALQELSLQSGLGTQELQVPSLTSFRSLESSWSERRQICLEMFESVFWGQFFGAFQVLNTSPVVFQDSRNLSQEAYSKENRHWIQEVSWSNESRVDEAIRNSSSLY